MELEHGGNKQNLNKKKELKTEGRNKEEIKKKMQQMKMLERNV